MPRLCECTETAGVDQSAVQFNKIKQDNNKNNKINK